MKTFRSVDDVLAADLTPSVRAVVEDVVSRLVTACSEDGRDYDADDDGYTVLIEACDTPKEVEAELGYTLANAPLEGVFRENGCFVAGLLFDNQFGLSLVVPDGPWLTPERGRRNLEENLVPLGSAAG